MRVIVIVVISMLLAACGAAPGWSEAEADGLVPRHEAALVGYDGDAYLIGGRGVKPVQRWDGEGWETLSETPLEIHHVQPVVVGDEIWLLGAFTGGWPHETAIPNVIIYDPATDTFRDGPNIPEARRRGAAGVVLHDGLIHVIGGITDGHWEGSVAWHDVLDPATGEWTVRPDAPTARDHHQIAVIEDRIYVAAGRRSQQKSGQGFEPTEDLMDIYDVASGEWLPPSTLHLIPTPRAGASVLAVDGKLVIAGGESGDQEEAHSEVEVFDPATDRWGTAQPFARGRHGTGLAIVDGELFTASGSGNRGGEPELTSHETAPLDMDMTWERWGDAPIVRGHHAFRITLEGPQASVTATPNPFTDYRMEVEIKMPDYHEVISVVRGHFAADGAAADTLATEGNLWQAVIRPRNELISQKYDWRARLYSGDGVALNGGGELIAQDEGSFLVLPSDKPAPDFRATGPLRADGTRLVTDDGPWLKLGTNSPENWLGYTGFANTYRLSDNARDGEATAGGELHSFAPHRADVPANIPTWNGDSSGIFGAAHYLADQGLNSVYMLTYNVEGDGKDVWPWVEPDDPTRFDVAKIAQWERAIAHFNALGIGVQLVVQETENELILDGGDTGPDRQLYFLELVSRLGHLPGITWNLGEENGPVHWRPEGQTDAQRMAMIDFLDANDPYDRPIVIHTHSEKADKDEILTPLLGHAGLDGLSFQVSEPEHVADETKKWIALARESGQPWLITMDEIGPWHTGAVSDGEVDDDRDRLRRHVLWGHLLAGGAGVEWYNGARNVGNDLTTEDFRLREGLWAMTRVARTVLDREGLFGELEPCPEKPLCAQTETVRVSYHELEDDTVTPRGAEVVDAQTGQGVTPETRDVIVIAER